MPDDAPTAKVTADGHGGYKVTVPQGTRLHMQFVGCVGEGGDDQLRVAMAMAATANKAKTDGTVGAGVSGAAEISNNVAVLTFILGDMVYPHPAAKAEKLPRYVEDMYGDQPGPVFFALGNHDKARSFFIRGVERGDDAAGPLLTHIRSLDFDKFHVSPDKSRNYYYVDVFEEGRDAPAIRYIVLDSSEYVQDETQRAWMKDRLNESTAARNIVLSHHPLKSFGKKRRWERTYYDMSDDDVEAKRSYTEALSQCFAEDVANVAEGKRPDTLICAHDHHQCLAEVELSIAKDGSATHKLKQITIGSGGEKPQSVKRYDGQQFFANDFGFCALEHETLATDPTLSFYEAPAKLEGGHTRQLAKFEFPKDRSPAAIVSLVDVYNAMVSALVGNKLTGRDKLRRIAAMQDVVRRATGEQKDAALSLVEWLSSKSLRKELPGLADDALQPKAKQTATQLGIETRKRSAAYAAGISVTTAAALGGGIYEAQARDYTCHQLCQQWPTLGGSHLAMGGVFLALLALLLAVLIYLFRRDAVEDKVLAEPMAYIAQPGKAC